jgi:uncharacterized membrane protein
MTEETETIIKQECRVCGAQYTSGSGAKRMHIHNDGWKRIKVTRPKTESVISYQPGYGPKV